MTFLCRKGLKQNCAEQLRHTQDRLHPSEYYLVSHTAPPSQATNRSERNHQYAKRVKCVTRAAGATYAFTTVLELRRFSRACPLSKQPVVKFRAQARILRQFWLPMRRKGTYSQPSALLIAEATAHSDRALRRGGERLLATQSLAPSCITEPITRAHEPTRFTVH